MATLSQDKWIGLVLAISSSVAIGTSFIITKKVGAAGERGSLLTAGLDGLLG